VTKNPFKNVPRALPDEDVMVLVAEDEPAIRSLVRHLLSRRGFRVMEAISGSDALRCWAEHKDEISVLLTDIVMPGVPNGHQLAARLRHDKPELRVITMSGYDPSEFAAAAQRAGHKGPHVQKPFSAAELLKAVDSTAGH
jgi:CheY-like chemotaxis protein